MSGFTIVPPSDRCDTLEGGLPSTDKEAVMVVYVTYRVPVEVELEIETGEIINVHIMDEKLEGPIGVFNYELLPIGGRLKEEVLKLVEVAEWPGWTFGY
jgi:hypothetical protein